jgi:hypothetical protein
MPDYRIENPYQALLAEGLQQEQVGVHFPTGYRRVFPIFRAIKDCSVPIQALHLHWISPYTKGESWLKRSLYSLKFLVDVSSLALWELKLFGQFTIASLMKVSFLD